VDVYPATVQELDIRLEAVRRESLMQSLRAVATVVPDESRISHVHTRVAGWVEQLDVNTTGELVAAGQPLAHIFSQELLSSQTEYLAARRNSAASGIASAVIAGGRTRLTVLGMTPSEIDGIEQTGEPKRLVTVVAPRKGVVVNRGITVGTSVDPSTTLLTIADLSRVWVIAEVPEAGIAAVRVGTTAELDFPASGRPPFAARVDFRYPTLTDRTRTLRVRFSASNTSGGLRPGNARHPLHATCQSSSQVGAHPSTESFRRDSAVSSEQIVCRRQNPCRPLVAASPVRTPRGKSAPHQSRASGNREIRVNRPRNARFSAAHWRTSRGSLDTSALVCRGLAFQRMRPRPPA
jgi:hypothetical protein